VTSHDDALAHSLDLIDNTQQQATRNNQLFSINKQVAATI